MINEKPYIKIPGEDFKAGYHLRPIDKGTYGEFSKVQEEIAELEDAYSQESKVLQIVEICDLLGALEAYATNHLGVQLSDLVYFKDITKRAFLNGHR